MASTDASTATAIRFRQEFGLQSDIEYVLAVASNPQASLDYGVPLLPDEVSELESRNSMATEAVPILEDYGSRNPEEYGGVFQDQQTGGVLVMSFTQRLDYHIPRVWDELWPEAPGALVRFRKVDHSEVELTALLERISSDIPSWTAQGIEIVVAAMDIQGNNVEIDVLNATADADERLAAEYGADWIRVVSVAEPPST
jgi:hypothetical protein